MYMKLKYNFTGSLAYLIGVFDEWKIVKECVQVVDYNNEKITNITEDRLQIDILMN